MKRVRCRCKNNFQCSFYGQLSITCAVLVSTGDIFPKSFYFSSCCPLQPYLLGFIFSTVSLKRCHKKIYGDVAQRLVLFSNCKYMTAYYDSVSLFFLSVSFLTGDNVCVLLPSLHVRLLLSPAAWYDVVLPDGKKAKFFSLSSVISGQSLWCIFCFCCLTSILRK